MESPKTFLNFDSIDFFDEDYDDFLEYVVEDRDLDKINAQMLSYRSRALSKRPLIILQKVQHKIYKRQRR